MSLVLHCVLCQARKTVKTGDFLGATASMVLARVLLVGDAEAVRHALCDPDRIAFEASLRVEMGGTRLLGVDDTKTE